VTAGSLPRTSEARQIARRKIRSRRQCRARGSRRRASQPPLERHVQPFEPTSRTTAKISHDKILMSRRSWAPALRDRDVPRLPAGPPAPATRSSVAGIRARGGPTDSGGFAQGARRPAAAVQPAPTDSTHPLPPPLKRSMRETGILEATAHDVGAPSAVVTRMPFSREHIRRFPGQCEGAWRQGRHRLIERPVPKLQVPSHKTAPGRTQPAMARRNVQCRRDERG